MCKTASRRCNHFKRYQPVEAPNDRAMSSCHPVIIIVPRSTARITSAGRSRRRKKDLPPPSATDSNPSIKHWERWTKAQFEGAQAGDAETRHWELLPSAVIVTVNIASRPHKPDKDKAAILAAPVAAASKETFSTAGRLKLEQLSLTKDALSSIYKTEWCAGMDEWEGFQKQDVIGDLVPRKEAMKGLGTRWHHTTCMFPKDKKAQLKSCLVGQGVKTIPFHTSFGQTSGGKSQKGAMPARFR